MRRRNRLSVRNQNSDDEVNPMDGVGNMADVMLCLAVGIMLALVTNLNADIGNDGKLRNKEGAGAMSGFSEGIDEGKAKEVDKSKITELDSGEVEASPDQGGYENYGQVYRDPKTGKIYIVTED